MPRAAGDSRGTFGPTTAALKAVQPQPLRAALFLCRQLPDLFSLAGGEVVYPHCATCGGLTRSLFVHCPTCHLDFTSPGHRCSVPPAPTPSALVLRARAALQLVELALPLSVMTKRGQGQWTPARRACWQRKVRHSTTSAAFMACLLLLEQCVARNSLARWFKWTQQTVASQRAVTSFAAFFVRLHAFDEAIRYASTESPAEDENEEEEGPGEKTKKRGVGNRPSRHGMCGEG